MPWTAADAKKHSKKADTSKKQKAWAKIANGEKARCDKKGEGDCEGRAVRVANAAVVKMGEASEGEFYEWFDEQDEEIQGRIIVHIYGLKSALGAERQLRKAAERRIREAQLWSNDVRELLRAALIDEAPSAKDGPSRYWVKDISIEDKFFVYEDYEDGNIYKRPYSIGEGGKVTMGDRQEVRVKSTYEPVTEAAQILGGDVIPLVESAVAADGTFPIKIMQPGWGNSGYYADKVLEQAGPEVFTKGTQMYWDHPTKTEEYDRPERSLRDLAGKLVEDASYDANGPYGPGLYSRGQVFDAFKDVVEELAPDIGLSMNARGRAHDGEAEGREGLIVEKIGEVRSVDFVTVPGAGGKVLELFESARGQPTRKKATEEEGKMPDDKELKEAFDELTKKHEQLVTDKEATDTETARLQEALLLRKARDVASEKLAEQDISEMTKARVLEAVSKDPPVKDGKLDEEAFTEAIEEAVKEEVAYLAELAESGAIRGMGGSSPEGGDAEEGDVKKLTEAWVAHYEGQGMSTEEAEVMAKRSVQGR